MSATPGAFLAPDQMTVGQGSMSTGQYRAELALYAVLAAPMFLSAPPSNIGPELLALITNPEILEVNSDPDCVMASQLFPSFTDSSYMDVWIRPLADGSFAVALVNRDPTMMHSVTLTLGLGQGDDGDFFPAAFPSAKVRDLVSRQDIGVHTYKFSVDVQSLDSRLLKVSNGI
eukprot:gene7074-167_t